MHCYQNDLWLRQYKEKCICCIAWFNACVIITAPRPECTTDPECPQHLACIQEKCQDPCYTSTCGVNAECKAKNHRAICVCIYGFVGDPYTICEERKTLSNIFFKDWENSKDLVLIEYQNHINLYACFWFSWMQKWFWMSTDPGMYWQRMSRPMPLRTMWCQRRM